MSSLSADKIGCYWVSSYGQDIRASYFCDEWEDKLSKGFHSTTFEMKKEKKKKQKITSLK